MLESMPVGTDLQIFGSVEEREQRDFLVPMIFGGGEFPLSFFGWLIKLACSMRLIVMDRWRCRSMLGIPAVGSWPELRG